MFKSFKQVLRLSTPNRLLNLKQSFSSHKVKLQTIAAFQDIVGTDNISSSDSIKEYHSIDESHFVPHPPDVVLFPASTREVQQCVQLCSQNSLPIIPFGTGTGVEGGVLALQGGVCIDMNRMDKIVAVHAEDFDAVVEPGVTRMTLNHFIKDEGLWFPIDPGADASICGMAATSASGTNAVKYGTMRENVINLEVVTPNGDIIHTAGPKGRPRKTAAGYNLTNLFVGSEGTLGIITQATIKVHGLPEAMVAAVCQFPSVQEAIDASKMILQCGIPIARIEFMDDLQMKMSNSYSHLDYKELPTLFFEFHGSEDSIKVQAESVGDITKEFGGTDFEYAIAQEDRHKLWKARHNALYAAVASRPGCRGYTTDVAVPISSLTDIIVRSKALAEKEGLIGPIVGHVGDGNFHMLVVVDPKDEAENKKAREVAQEMAEMAIDMGGTCTGEHGVGIGKRHLLIKEHDETGIALMKQLKATIDPQNIMNPGKVL